MEDSKGKEKDRGNRNDKEALRARFEAGELWPFVLQFNDVRTNQPPGYERSIACDKIVMGLRACIDKSKEAVRLISLIGDLLEGSEGEQMLALTFLTQIAEGSPVADRVWDKLLSMLQEGPLFLQHLTRLTVESYVWTGMLTVKQTERACEAVQKVSEMAEDNDHTKRQSFVHSMLPLLTKRVEGPTKSQLLGCLIGQCTGDALGFPVEGQRREMTAAYSEIFIRGLKAPKEARGGHLFGQFTDDSQLAREWLLSLVENEGNFVPQDYANRIGAMFIPPHYKIVGFGSTTEQAAQLINEGISWRSSGVLGSGNGSAMRAAPIGLAFSRCDLDTLRRVTVDQGIVTHARSQCSASAVAIAVAARLAAETPSSLFNSDRFLSTISRIVAPVDNLVANQISKMQKDWLRLPLAEALPLCVAAGVACGDKTWGEGQVISSSAVQAALWALYSFVNNSNDWTACVATAIEGGGDTDTTAAMAGAICGAHVGLDGIPTVFTEHLHDKDSWKLENLLKLGEKVFELVANGSVRYE